MLVVIPEKSCIKFSTHVFAGMVHITVLRKLFLSKNKKCIHNIEIFIIQIKEFFYILEISQSSVMVKWLLFSLCSSLEHQYLIKSL